METKEAQQVYFEWLETPHYKRDPKTKAELAVQLGYSYDTLMKWAKKKPKYDSKEFLASRTLEVDQALVEACKAGRGDALRIYFQLMNRLVDKSETKVKLSLDADDIARINREAKERVNRELNRIHSLPRQPDLLPD